MFINKHERPDMMKNQKHFLKVIKELEPYLIEFDKIGQMISKIYPSDCEVEGDKC